MAERLVTSIWWTVGKAFPLSIPPDPRERSATFLVPSILDDVVRSAIEIELMCSGYGNEARVAHEEEVVVGSGNRLPEDRSPDQDSATIAQPRIFEGIVGRILLEYRCISIRREGIPVACPVTLAHAAARMRLACGITPFYGAVLHARCRIVTVGMGRLDGTAKGDQVAGV